MAACVDIKEDLKAYADGELGNGRRSAVRSHLDGCEQCARDLAEIERYSVTLRALDHAEPRPELRRRILASLPDSPAPVQRFRLPWLFPTFAGAAAAAALLGFFLFRPLPQSIAPTNGRTDKSALAAKGRAKSIARNNPQPDSYKKDRLEEESRDISRLHGKSESPAAEPPKRVMGKPAVAPSPLTTSAPKMDGNLRRNLATSQFRTPSQTGPRADEPAGPPAIRARSDDVAKAGLSRESEKSVAAATVPADKKPFSEVAPDFALGATTIKRSAQDADGTLVLMVDNLETGLAYVQSAARDQGGTSQVLSKQENTALGLQVTLPADRVEALKQKLSETDSVRFYYAAPAQANGSLPQEPANSSLRGGFGYGAGGFGGGGGMQSKPQGQAAQSAGGRGEKGTVDRRGAAANSPQQQTTGKSIQQESIEQRAFGRKAGLSKAKFDNNVQLRNESQNNKTPGNQNQLRDGVKDELTTNARMLKAQAAKPAPMFRLNIQLKQNPKTDPKAGGKAGN